MFKNDAEIEGDTTLHGVAQEKKQPYHFIPFVGQRNQKDRIVSL